MVDLRIYDVTFLVAVDRCCAFESKVVGLSNSAYEDDLLVLGANEIGNSLAGLFTGLLSLPTKL